MNLLDLYEGREPYQQAIDKLEQARIDHLKEKMDYYAKHKMAEQFKKAKEEYDSYFKVQDECMGYGGLTSEAGIPGNVPTEKIPGKEDLLKGKGRSYYEADQKKNSEKVNEYLTQVSDKNFQESEPYKNYKIYVRRKPFGNTGIYTAHTEIDRKEFMGKGLSQEEAIAAVRDRIDFVLNAQRKVTGSSTIDFNVKFATDLLADPRQTFYAKLENVNGEPKLIIASPDVASDPELLAAGDFKKSALRNQVDDEGRATPLPGIPLTAKGLRSGDWIANGRYTIGRETQDRDGNRVFDLTYHSTAHTKSDKLRLNQPAFTLGTAREVDEEKKSPLNQRLDRLKIQAHREFPQVDSDAEALLLKLLDKEASDDRLSRQTDARHDAELRRNFSLDRDQEDEIEDLQAQLPVKEQNDWDDADEFGDEDDRLRDSDYVRDSQDGEYGEVFRMSGDPGERRVRILDRDGRGWYIGPERLVAVDRNDPAIQRYFGKQRVRDMDESDVDEGWSNKMVARRTGQAPTPYSVYIKGKEWKSFADDDHAENVANKLRARFKQEGKDPGVITIAPSGLDEGMEEGIVASGPSHPLDDRAVRKIVWDTMKINADTGEQALQRALSVLAKKPQSRMVQDLQDKFQTLADRLGQRVAEDQDTSGVESAIIRRIMVAHTDLLMKYGPQKVMQAAEEVAYNVGDVDEIGTSDVSAYIAQVKQILGVPEELDEKWSQKYKSSINCASPKGFSQKAHCAGKKK